jgi:hypothetical protein
MQNQGPRNNHIEGVTRQKQALFASGVVQQARRVAKRDAIEDRTLERPEACRDDL